MEQTGKGRKKICAGEREQSIHGGFSQPGAGPTSRTETVMKNATRLGHFCALDFRGELSYFPFRTCCTLSFVHTKPCKCSSRTGSQRVGVKDSELPSNDKNVYSCKQYAQL